jgi:hypothetical protein
MAAGQRCVDRLADQLGLSSAASFRGGRNYAFGGATAISNGGIPSLTDQRNLYLVQNVIDAALVNPQSLATAEAVLTQSVNDLRASIVALGQAGASSVLVPNLPYIGFLPKQTRYGSQGLIDLGAGLLMLGLRVRRMPAGASARGTLG